MRAYIYFHIGSFFAFLHAHKGVVLRYDEG
jgi:hypothetical protein